MGKLPKSIGIIGGMGPLATCDLMEKIIRNTRAETDQDHIHIYVDCNTQIPDRTKAILGEGPDPVPQMLVSAAKLKQMGADLLVMPCNTAHYFYERIAAGVDLPLLHMPRETARALAEAGVTCAGVLATDGTVKSGVYDQVLREAGIRPVYPKEGGQQLVMELIYDYVKAGRRDVTGLPMEDLFADLQKQGAQQLVLGCTELPIAFAALIDAGVCVPASIDPTLVLARAAIRAAGRTML